MCGSLKKKIQTFQAVRTHFLRSNSRERQKKKKKKMLTTEQVNTELIV